MRILHVNKFLYRRGGAEAYMRDLADLQVAAGDAVAFFGMDHPDNDAMEYSRYFPSYVEFRPSGPALRERARAAGRMLYSPSAERGMERVLADFRPDVVHLHNIYHQLSPSILRPIARRRVPVVMTLHDYKLACPTYQFLDHGRICEACLDGHFYHAVVRRCKDGSLAASLLAATESYLHSLTRAYAAVSVFICPSHFLAGRMKAADVFPTRLRQLNHFVDARNIDVKSRPGGAFVFAGRLSAEKGADVLVTAAGRGAGHEVLLLGEGPARPELEAISSSLERGSVRFMGRVGKREVERLMRSALAVVVPSRWHENQPVTILEAFACGVPVIGSSLGGIPELIVDGVTGLIIPPDDPSALAEAMARLEADPELAFEMGREARRRVETLFSPAAHLDRLRELYEEAGLPAAVMA